MSTNELEVGLEKSIQERFMAKADSHGRGRPQPLHQKLFEHFREQILAGELTPGTRLPAEGALSETFGMSRGTVRQALRALELEGLLERTPGRGTFVKAQVVPTQARFIGLVLPYGDGHEVFFMDIMRGVRAAAHSRGLQVLFGYSHESDVQEAREIGRLKDAGCAGLIVFAHAPETAVPLLQKQRFPFVLLDRHHPETETDFVGVDNAAGAYRATEHLLLLGHRSVAFIHYNDGSPSLALTPVGDRWRGYRKALDDYGVPYDERWFYGGAPYEGDDEALAYLEFFRQEARPTAAFVVNDRTAIFFVRAARLAGCALPGDLALVSFDDLPVVRQLGVALSSVHQPRYDLGFRAAHLLADRLGGETMGPIQIVLPTELKIRESCGVRRSVALRDAS